MSQVASGVSSPSSDVAYGVNIYLAAYVIVSIEQCPFAATCRLLTHSQEREGPDSSEGSEEKEIRLHQYDCATGLAAKHDAGERNGHKGRVASLLTVDVMIR